MSAPGSAGQIEHIAEIELPAFPIPPALLTAMAREEPQLGTVTEAVIDLDHVTGAALRTIHD